MKTLKKYINDEINTCYNAILKIKVLNENELTPLEEKTVLIYQTKLETLIKISDICNERRRF